ncbi:BofC C-terminal domain-containing protein [Aquibacillus salsiterrae]|uniref:Intercompartmental signaling factor BofC n=1 Tax=Aquibacillus salsiterrae TaxID=2950439 RepID=A0A9X3WB07_9BACI|nr:BofC C-terminal domain-containing protein [Aquibacillus salsiterrae]MDC3415647.1 intercompartmental signaling factor BofC [Aquibacillus salsiterrae]
MKKQLFLLALFYVMLVSGVAISADAQDQQAQDEQKQKESSVTENNNSTFQQDPLEIEITLQKYYLDGRVEESTFKETIWSMEDFWANYQDWQLVEQHQGEIVFKQDIADISPYLKENGYFGLKNDILTIFEGKPEDEQIIESFYQIDTSELESNQAKQLKAGIKIDTKEVYRFVLDSYKQVTRQLNS